jgi:hypothetical protein
VGNPPGNRCTYWQMLWRVSVRCVQTESQCWRPRLELSILRRWRETRYSRHLSVANRSNSEHQRVEAILLALPIAEDNTTLCRNFSCPSTRRAIAALSTRAQSPIVLAKVADSADCAWRAPSPMSRKCRWATSYAPTNDCSTFLIGIISNGRRYCVERMFKRKRTVFAHSCEGYVNASALVC